MWIIIGSLLLLGCVIFIAITLLSYTSNASSLSLQLEDIEQNIDHKTGRLEDYRSRAELLQNSVPQLNQQTARLKRWITILKKQKGQLDSSTPGGKNATQRDAAIRSSLSTVKKRKA
jgi:chromosome segregation ATPase